MKKIFSILILCICLSFVVFGNELAKPLEGHENDIVNVIESISHGATETALSVLNELNAVISKTSAQITGLDFSVKVHTVIGPVFIPKGLYKVYFIGDGDVYCYDLDGEYIGSPCDGDDTTQYTSNLFKCAGETVLLKIRTYTPCHFYFEKIN